MQPQREGDSVSGREAAAATQEDHQKGRQEGMKEERGRKEERMGDAGRERRAKRL